MSYILDALKKADHARQDSGAPVPEPMVETPSMARNLNWQKIAIVFVGVNLVLAASLAIYRGLYPVADEPPMMTTATEMEKPRQPIVPPPTGPKAGSPVTAPPTVKPGQALTVPPTSDATIPDKQTLMDEIAAMDAMVAELAQELPATAMSDQAGNTPVSPDMHAVPAGQGNRQPAKSSSRTRNKSAVEPLIQQVEVRDQTAIAAAPPIEPPTLPPMRSSPERALPEEPPVSNNQESDPYLMDVPLLKEKPFGFRQTVPAFVIDIHVYSEIPAKRFTMINMKRRREGDDMGNNLKLISITQKGVVMSYQGEMFQVNVQ